MNEQKPPAAIEWTRVWGRRGFTWNVITGCHHDCHWTMPDGKVVECYAKTVAEGVAQTAYPKGFEHHYFHPERLDEPLKLKELAGIFLDSMSDLMGHWVPEEQVQQVLDVCRRADHHIFFLLTKNAPRLLKFTYPDNVWVGISAPPTRYMRKTLSPFQQSAYWHKATFVFQQLEAKVKWFSIEPLTHYTPYLEEADIQWAVLGAASEGKTYYQPDRTVLDMTVDILEQRGIPRFYKGNLRPSLGHDWREEFPAQPERVTQGELL